MFVLTAWDGNPTEPDVIKPEWYNLSSLPDGRMWDDSKYWPSLVLKVSKLKERRFIAKEC